MPNKKLITINIYKHLYILIYNLSLKRMIYKFIKLKVFLMTNINI